MTTISATSVLASKHALSDDRLDTILLRYPQWLHTEFLTHLGSCNASPLRAVPTETLVKDVTDDPAVPLFWGKNQKGTQANEDCAEPVNMNRVRMEDGHWFVTPLYREDAWLEAMNQAVRTARGFSDAGYDKRIVNHLLDPFSHIDVLVSATDWSDVFALDDGPDAEPHIQMLARAIRKARNEAKVQILEPGDWHLPFSTSEEIATLQFLDTYRDKTNYRDFLGKLQTKAVRSTGGASSGMATDLILSPEHVAQADEKLAFTANRQSPWLNFRQHHDFRGFRQLRAILEDDPYFRQ